ncbi:hypothetical protein GCM10027188_28920 [Lysobacter humi (ex Lee et al. 2017)]
MRTGLVALMAFTLVGCASKPAATLSGVEVRLGSCIPPGSVLVRLQLFNGSEERVAFRTYGPAGPPFKLHPAAVQLQRSATGEPWQIILEHFVPASHEVSLGAGDEAGFVVQPSPWPSLYEPGLFRVEVRDTVGRPHYSKELGLCHPGSAPNNSSKPTPLRGAA